MLPDSLKFHAFPIAVWNEAVPLQREADPRGVDAESNEIDEYQFFVMRVGYHLAQITTWMEQLDYAVYFLSDFSYSARAKDEGINRAKHLIYNVENYLIRLHSVYDRALQLTNSVFHLGIEESNVSHSVIVSNLKVSRTNTKSLLKQVKKECERKAQERHTIVHRESHQEENLRRLELFYMFDKENWEQKESTLSFEGLSHIRSQLMRDVVADKKREYSELNKAVFTKVENLFTGLHGQYEKEQKRLKLYVYGTSA